MKTLAIYGAGGLGREVLELAQRINSVKPKWKDFIFIDDNLDIAKTGNTLILGLDEVGSAFSINDIEFCVAVGDPRIREALFDKLIAKDYLIATLIDPSCEIPTSTKIGKGVIVCNFVSITCNIDISDNVYIHPFASIGHDAEIGQHSVISVFNAVAGSCMLGKNVFLGTGVIIKQNVNIGNDVIIGMGSVVHTNIRDNVIAMGNPARPMKENHGKSIFTK